MITCTKYQNNFNVFIQYSIIYTYLCILSALCQLFHHDSARLVEMVEMVETCIFYYILFRYLPYNIMLTTK